MQSAVSAGVSTLRAEAVADLTSAIQRCQQRGGGFCGLDGKPDLYYSFFAKLLLDALGGAYEHSALIAWASSARPGAFGVDRVCAELILLRQGARSRVSATFFLLRSFARIGAVDSYKLFLTVFLMEALLPRWLCRLLIKRAAAATLRQRLQTDFNALSTPRAAVCALLACRIGDQEMWERMAELLRQRHLPTGGYASVAGAGADLLSTAVALFTGSFLSNAQSFSAETRSDNNVCCVNSHLDRAFVEMCWQDDALFSSAPDQLSGDLEHTFYALLALGCA